MFKGWKHVGKLLHTYADDIESVPLTKGQRDTLRALVTRLPSHGVIVADEVGMGKTRIASLVAKAVTAAGGRVAIAIPAGLGTQWQDELDKVGCEAPDVLRSLIGYLDAWTTQRISAGVWAERNILLLSHNLFNWSLGPRTRDAWRWALLPMTLALHVQRMNGRLPRDSAAFTQHADAAKARPAAEWMARNRESALTKLLADNPDLMQWGKSSPLLNPADYGSTSPCRSALENVVGIGLGTFDLVIIDEAHRSRRDNSRLNRLLKSLQTTSDTRRLSITATPVELTPHQWHSALERIGQNLENPQVVDAYLQAVAQIRRAPQCDDALKTLKERACAFEDLLAPYVLRRGKRHDPTIRKFAEHSQKSADSYRQRDDICIDTPALNDAWKQAICGAEALSLIRGQADGDQKTRRLRLTIANGHGISALLTPQQGELEHAEESEGNPEALESTASAMRTPKAVAPQPISAQGDAKRQARLDWWKQVVSSPFTKAPDSGTDVDPLLNHPAIVAVADAAEQTLARSDGKVLVFGKFTAPLRALTLLLNARHLLRSKGHGVAAGSSSTQHEAIWTKSGIQEALMPQSHPGLGEWAAIRAAWTQLGERGEPDRNDIEQWMQAGHARLERSRKKFRTNLLTRLDAGLADLASLHPAAYTIFKAFAQACRSDGGTEILALMARALREGLSPAPSDAEIAQAFVALVSSLDDQADEAADEPSKHHVSWSALHEHLAQYNTTENGHARLMHGPTELPARKLMQDAFNRKDSRLKILVAHSAVGREGLNLHKACRTVILLHAEWNPGVVEQQLGRVDRLGSLWEQTLETCIKDRNTQVPLITYRPVIFKGTYDDMHWSTLTQRWRQLRAQLHGIIVQDETDEFGCSPERIREINDSAPDFAPTKTLSLPF